MNRRDLFRRSTAFGVAAGISSLVGAYRSIADEPMPVSTVEPHPLVPPAKGPIPVAFVISKGAVVIDFCGPWEVFQDGPGFQLYTVAETSEPVEASSGLKVVPDFTFATAPPPKVIVIPAQDGESPAMLAWIRASAKTADLTMSVCTGAFVLARTGLLAGKAATTHHGSYTEFALAFPDVQLKRGARFVEDGGVASSGGLSSGIDLALRVVERYHGRSQAEQTADVMEYQGQGWLNPDSNAAYAKARVSTDAHPLCPICSMDADRTIRSSYKGKTYYFCMTDHQKMFDAAPDKFVGA